MTTYQATYKDPVDGQITHYWQFKAVNDYHAIATARESLLQRRDGLDDVLFHLEALL